MPTKDLEDHARPEFAGLAVAGRRGRALHQPPAVRRHHRAGVSTRHSQASLHKRRIETAIGLAVLAKDPAAGYRRAHRLWRLSGRQRGPQPVATEQRESSSRPTVTRDCSRCCRSATSRPTSITSDMAACTGEPRLPERPVRPDRDHQPRPGFDGGSLQVAQNLLVGRCMLTRSV